MEWYIIFDPSYYSHLVMTDYHILRDADGVCWKRTLDFTQITPSDIIVTDYLQENDHIIIFHKFVSDNPISYVNNLQSSYPELFI